MNKILLLSLAISASASVWAVELQPSQNDKGKWGFVDESGSIVVDYKYDDVVPFDGRYAKVCKKDKWGYIDLAGTEVLKPEYQDITDFDGGVARVTKGDKSGYINQDMEAVVPCRFSSVGSFNDNGLVLVQDGQKYGIYRKDGSVFIEPKYKSIGVFVPWVYNYDESKFEKSSYAYKSHYRLNGSHHLYRKSKIEAKPLAKLPEDPVGYYYSPDAAGYKNSVVDPSGKVLVECGKYYTAFYPTDGIVPVIIKSGKFNYLNLSTGKWLLSKDAVDGWGFNDGVALIQVKEGKTKKWEFINEDGAPVSAMMYDAIFPRVNNVYITLKDDKYGMADSKGHNIIEPSYNMIISTTGQFFGAMKESNGKFGFLNNKGEWAISPIYSSVDAYQHGYYGVKKNDKWGLMDGDGNMVFDCLWVNMKIPTHADQELFWVTTESGDNAAYQAFSRTKQKIAFDGKYIGTWNFDVHFPGVALVHNGDGKYGCVGNDGRVVIPLEFNDFEVVKAGYNMLQSRENKTWRAIDTHRLRLSADASNKSYRLNQQLNNENWEY